MKNSRFTDQQIAFALGQAEQGTPVAEVCRRMGIVIRVLNRMFYCGRPESIRIA